MQKHEENLAARINGNALQPLAGASVTVTSDATGLPAALYSDDGVTPLAQPIITGNEGQYAFYAANGEYTVTFSGTRFATFKRKIILADPSDNPYATQAALAAPSGATLVGHGASTVTAVLDSQSSAMQTLVDMTETNKAALDLIAGSSGAAQVGFLQAGTGAVARTAEDKGRDVVHIKDYGAVCDGVADDTQSLINADAAAVARRTTLIISGTPLIKQSLTFSGKSHWRFEGGTGVLDAGNDPSASRLIKHASVNGALATFTANGVVLEGVAASGQSGNVGDGLVFWGNSPRIIGAYVTGMGQDGIRLGRDAGLAANVNSFYLENPRCISNGRDGININDEPGGAPDVNAGSLINPICTSNGRHGFYGGNSFLGVTIICPTMEANTGWGMYLDTAFRQNIIIGGDCEANVAGDMYRANKYGNIVIGTSVQGKTIYDRAQLSSYTPVIYGGDVAGTCTYTSQLGEFEVSGASVNFAVTVSYSGHTGTGQAYISLPLTPYVALPNLTFMPVQVVTSGLTVTAGAQVVGLISRDGGRVQLYTNNAGALGSLTLPAAGTFYVRGSYPLNAPNFFAV